MRWQILTYPVWLLFPMLAFTRQVTIGKINEQAPLNKKYEYAFPRIIYPANKAVAGKINNTLVVDFLDTDPKKVRQSIFENVWPQEEDAMPSLNGITWTVHTNSARLLSLSIMAEGCGAYCEEFTNYYSFDLRTGQRLPLARLLTKEGVQRLSDSVYLLWNHKIRSTLKTLRESLRDTLQTDQESVKEAIELYGHCLEQGGIGMVDNLPFHLSGGYLFVHIGRCSAHYNRALDELGGFEFSFRLADLKQYLSPDGRQLFPQ